MARKSLVKQEFFTIRTVNDIDEVCKKDLESHYKIWIIEKLIDEWRNK